MLIQINNTIDKNANILIQKNDNVIYYKLIPNKQEPNSNINLINNKFKNELEKYETKFFIK